MNKNLYPCSESFQTQTEFPLVIKAVMIDLDGTLLDTAGDLAIAANMMLQELGKAELPLSTIQSYIGNGIQNLVKKSLTQSFGDELDAGLFSRAMTIYEREYKKNLCITTHPYPRAIDGLVAMKNAGFQLACITNKSEAFTLPLLQATDLLDYFDVILSGDSLPRKKPDPMPLHHACSLFKILPREMLLIGDSLNDSEAARAAGCYVFCVPYGYSEGRNVLEIDCDAIIPSIFDAMDLIKKPA